jgi:hypothetical protein
MTTTIIIIFILIFSIGLITLLRRQNKYVQKHNFAFDYREKFIELSNKYFATIYDRNGTLDSELYMWLTKNVNKMQADLGHLGTMHYVAPFQIYQIKNYQIVINTLPKFRNGQVEDFDINSADDSLLRYIGVLEKALESIRKKIKNPIICFKEGFQEVISLPLYIFNWFGLLSDNSVSKVTTNIIFKIFAGISGLVAFASGIVTIVQGKEQMISLINKIFGH